MSVLDELLTRLDGLPAETRKELEKTAVQATKHLVWAPNPGPQLDAYFHPADELFYGGQAGGGKTDLAIGLALTAHKRSLLLRRIKGDAIKLVARIEEVLGHRDGYNGQHYHWRLDGRQIDLNGCEQEVDKQRFKGDPHDLIVFDEGSDFLESQYRFIIGWNRSADPKQRCRVLLTSNPPTSTDGLWVIRYWAPWLDPLHPNPAKPGELRWFTTVNGADQEVDGPGPHILPGEPQPVMARSRSYLPASLSDNPDLARTNYASVLAALPDVLRRAYRDGDFNVSLKDADWQVIPTAWVLAAEQRWTERPPAGTAMTAMALDAAGGGTDEAALSYRYGGWFAPLQSVQGPETADASAMAAFVIRYRRDGAPVVVDMGGGYGGQASIRMRDNGVAVERFNGADGSTARAVGSGLQFVNKRAEAFWRFREALDPDQEGGSAIALPPDAQLRADLCAATYKLTVSGIQIEAKESIKKRLGRSPDRGDAVIMCLHFGGRAAARMERSRSMRTPEVNLGHSQVKAHYR